MEATQRAQPQVTLQVTVVQWKNVDSNQSTPLTKELFTILVDNALQVRPWHSIVGIRAEPIPAVGR
jgi:hypothetical protein